MIRREGGRVLIEIDEEQFESLLMALGMAVGSALKCDNGSAARTWANLANSINGGNPQWKPYEVLES